MRIGTVKNCPICGKEFYVFPSSNRTYCSSQCYGASVKGKIKSNHRPLIYPEKGKQYLKTGSIIDWDSISREIFPGNTSTHPAIKVTCGKCQQVRSTVLWNLRRQLKNPLYTGFCADCWRGLRWSEKGRYRPELRKPHRGYIKLFVPDHPMADKRGEVFEHRLVMSEILGRPLRHYEHVHHKNGNKGDNRPENLELVEAGKHALITSLETRIRLLESILAEHQIPIPL